MVVRYFIEVPLPAGQVEQALLESPAGWLSAIAGVAQERGDGLLVEVGVGPMEARLRRRVSMRLGEPVRFPSMTSVPSPGSRSAWKASSPASTPTSSSAPLGEDRTQLAISARYQPPLGVVGHALDRVLLHRVAGATLKDFLDRVGQVIALSQTGGPATMGS
jgi:hypothetical protein